MIRKELNVFFTAVMFYSRIPVPKTEFSNEILNKSTRYFPLVGWIIGGIGALVFWGLSLFLPVNIAVLGSMVVTVLATGAFHEDAFSDFCDGFGGGYTPQRILEIMKDSRIGTYGAVGIVLMLLTKYNSLNSIKPDQLMLVIWCGHAISRLFPVFFIYSSSYVREDALSKSKPIGHKGSLLSLFLAMVFGLIPMFFLPWKIVVFNLLLLTLVFLFFRGYAVKKLGGYTGDVLGALQQLSEIAFYLGFLTFQSIV